jgi:hypothetical protein
MQNLKNSQNLLEKIRSTQILKHSAFLALGILSWLGFSYLFVLSIKIPKGRSIYDFPWSDDAPIWSFGFCLTGASLTILTKWSFGLLSEKSKSVFRDFVVLLCLIPVNSLIITTFSILVLKITDSGGERPIEFDWVMGFLSQFMLQVFVSFSCIGYFYLTLVNKTKERLLYTQKAKSEMELKILQQNIEPHFLFNNLNVLSSLIDSNPARANEFLSRLAELYRYILQTRNVEIVPLKQELAFSQNYVYLLQERFGEVYHFDWQVAENKLNGQMIIPVTLQTLLENAVKHNAGNQENPLHISIRLEDNNLIVQNEMRVKNLTFPTNKTGLQNLKMRYDLLSEKPLEILQTEKTFTVKLPLLVQR